MMMHALVAGGGVAGPAVAVGLRRAGWSATVLESRPGADVDAGAFLVLAPNGVQALAGLGLAGVLQSAGALPVDGIRFQNDSGRQIAAIDGSQDRARYGARSHLVRRGRLHAALLEAACAAGAEVVHGARVATVAPGPDEVSVGLADGRSVTGAVLLGADGVHSTVRGAVLPDSPAPAYTGLVDCGEWTQVDLPDTSGQVMVFGRRAFFGYVVRNATAYWFTNVAEPEAPGSWPDGDPAAWLARVRELQADAPPPVRQILDAATAPVGRWAIHDLAHLPTWHAGRVCLLGDAAHAASPSAGQGASLALEDAAVLTRCLVELPDHGAAFDAFQRARRPRAEAVVAAGRRLSDRKVPTGAGAWFRDLLLPLFLRAGAARAAELYGYRVPDVALLPQSR